MTCLKLTLPASGTVPALLTRPRPVTAQTLRELEHSVIETLALLRSDLSGAGVGMSPAYVPSRPDAAEIEYASWMPDPGGIEVASWAANMRIALR